MWVLGILIQLAIGSAVAAILIYLIIRRIQQKEQEDFEQRDN